MNRFSVRTTAWIVITAAGMGFLGGLAGSMLRDVPSQQQNRLTSIDGQLSDNAASNEPVVQVVERAAPAVVAVVVSEEIPEFEEVPIDPFLGFPLIRRPTGEMHERVVGGGSGFVVDGRQGLLVTNRHVVAREDKIYHVIFHDGERLPAEVVARDPMFDLALLRVRKANLPEISLASSEDVQVGQTVVAIGNALNEFMNTVSVGVVSALGRQIEASDRLTGATEVLDQVIQTDAAINPGNSGGPLLDRLGRAIGINTATVGIAENIGFAIPADEISRIVDDFREHGRIVRPILGVRYVAVTPSIQSMLDLPVNHGALLISGSVSGSFAVVPGSGADKAGLKEGDIITMIDGVSITEERSLQSVIRTRKPGDTVVVTVYSDGKRREASVTLSEATE